ncbi:MAG: SPASM domain-containing protein, partial [Acetobacteraceae bacterium]|nr:SPASM domain-containing protein [Acetobacteraceae bacterium]
WLDEGVEVSLSLDGPREVHDSCRVDGLGQGSFHRIERLLGQLAGPGRRNGLRVRATISPAAARRLAEALDFWLGLGIRHITATPDFHDPAWTPQATAALLDQLERTAERYASARARGEGFRFQAFEVRAAKGAQGRLPQACGAGDFSFAISPQGDLYPCNFSYLLPDRRLGNVHQDDWSRMARPVSREYNPFRRRVCVGCAEFATCNSVRCPYLNLSLTGDMHRPTGFLCQYERLVGELGRRLAREAPAQGEGRGWQPDGEGGARA